MEAHNRDFRSENIKNLYPTIKSELDQLIADGDVKFVTIAGDRTKSSDVAATTKGKIFLGKLHIPQRQMPAGNYDFGPNTHFYERQALVQLFLNAAPENALHDVHTSFAAAERIHLPILKDTTLQTLIANGSITAATEKAHAYLQEIGYTVPPLAVAETIAPAPHEEPAAPETPTIAEAPVKRAEMIEHVPSPEKIPALDHPNIQALYELIASGDVAVGYTKTPSHAENGKLTYSIEHILATDAALPLLATLGIQNPIDLAVGQFSHVVDGQQFLRSFIDRSDRYDYLVAGAQEALRLGTNYHVPDLSLRLQEKALHEKGTFAAEVPSAEPTLTEALLAETKAESAINPAEQPEELETVATVTEEAEPTRPEASTPAHDEDARALKELEREQLVAYIASGDIKIIKRDGQVTHVVATEKAHPFLHKDLGQNIAGYAEIASYELGENTRPYNAEKLCAYFNPEHASEGLDKTLFDGAIELQKRIYEAKAPAVMAVAAPVPSAENNELAEFSKQIEAGNIKFLANVNGVKQVATTDKGHLFLKSLGLHLNSTAEASRYDVGFNRYPYALENITNHFGIDAEHAVFREVQKIQPRVVQAEQTPQATTPAEAERTSSSAPAIEIPKPATPVTTLETKTVQPARLVEPTVKAKVGFTTDTVSGAAIVKGIHLLGGKPVKILGRDNNPETFRVYAGVSIEENPNHEGYFTLRWKGTESAETSRFIDSLVPQESGNRVKLKGSVYYEREALAIAINKLTEAVDKTMNVAVNSPASFSSKLVTLQRSIDNGHER